MEESLVDVIEDVTDEWNCDKYYYLKNTNYNLFI